MQTFQLLLSASEKTDTNDALIDMTGIPKEYHDFSDVFSKARANTVALHWPYNLKIELEDGTSPPFSLIYSLSQSELKTLQEFLDKHILMGFICPSQYPGGAPVLFACKKDSSLQ